MGSAAATMMQGINEDIDHDTFKQICGNRYDIDLWNALKNDCGFVSKLAFQKEMSTKTHVFLTHDWGIDEHGRNNHERVKRVNDWLKAHGVATWFDEEKMTVSFQTLFNNPTIPDCHLIKSFVVYHDVREMWFNRCLMVLTTAVW